MIRVSNICRLFVFVGLSVSSLQAASFQQSIVRVKSTLQGWSQHRPWQKGKTLKQESLAVMVSKPWAAGPVSARLSSQAKMKPSIPRMEKIHIPGMCPSGLEALAPARSFDLPTAQLNAASPMFWIMVIRP